MVAVSSEPPGLAFAKTLVSWGGRVAPGFCSKAGEKVPFCGGNWVQKATLDVEQLERWWAERRWLWPGVVGGVGGLIVLDCDSPVGVEWFRTLVAGIGWTRGAFVYRTPGRGGGLHVLWKWPEWLGTDFRSAKVYIDGGEVQLRGNGHWTLMCGAPRPDIGPGQQYSVVEEPDWAKGPVEAPEGLLRAFLRESVVSVGACSGAGGEVEQISPEEAWALAPLYDGKKNALAGLAWWLAIRQRSDVVEVCVRFGEECCIPSLSEETCRKKAEYAVERAEVYRTKSAAEAEQTIGFLKRKCQ